MPLTSPNATALPPRGAPWTLHLIPNTHWDREWYLSFERYRLRLVRLMDRLLDLLDRDPEFRSFTLDGQYIPVRDYLELRPEREADLARLARAGRLLLGPWFTQPLETLAGGEALIRNLMLGIRQSRRYGAPLMISYMIDEFGHVSQMPQILAGFGIGSAVAWRGVPPSAKSVFRWQSPDGSAVLMFHSNGGYGEATALPEGMEDFTEVIDDTSFERQGLRNRIQGILNLRTPRATTRHLLALNGIDHSSVQENLTEIVRRIDAGCPDVRAVHSDLEAFTKAVRAVHEQEGLGYQVFEGELYDDAEPVLEAIHSFRVEQKIANDRTESQLVRWAEPLSALAWALGGTYPGGALWQAWDLLLQNHTHDSVGCSSADSVYREVMMRYERAGDIAQELTGEGLQWLAGAVAARPERQAADKTVLLFNPLSWERAGAVTAEIDIPEAAGIDAPVFFRGATRLPAVIEERRSTVAIRFNPQRGHSTKVPIRRCRVTLEPGVIPPLGYAALSLRNGPPAPEAPGLAVGPAALENETLRLAAAGDGTLDLLHKPTGRRFEGLHVFEDNGENGSGYDHIPPRRDRLIRSDTFPAKVAVVLNTPLKAALRIETALRLPAALAAGRRARGAKRVPYPIVSTVTLTRGSPRVDIETRIDNRARDHRLRVLFPCGIAATHACAEQPFDVVARPIAAPREPPRPGAPIVTTRPQQGFVDVSDGAAGLAIANEGLYEYEVKDDAARTIAITLLRCTDRIDPGVFAQAEDLAIPLGQSPGERVFRYSVIPHAGDWREACRPAWEFRVPARAVLRRAPEESVLPGYVPPPVTGRLPAEHSFLRVEPDALVVTALKKHESRDTLVARLWNSADESRNGSARVAIPGRRVAAAWATDLNEERRESLAVASDGSVAVALRPRGLFTIEWEMT
jgi:alpha-mannosidase